MASKPVKYLVKRPTQNKRLAEIEALEARAMDPNDPYRAADHFGEDETPLWEPENEGEDGPYEVKDFADDVE